MKRKVWNITVKDNPNRVVMGENDEFYTTDTEAYLVFNLDDKNFDPETAVLTLENRNDGSLKNEKIDVVDGLIEWEMPQRYIEHFGNWQGQLVYYDPKEDVPEDAPEEDKFETYTSAPFSFVVNAHIGDKKKPSLVEIENWEKFIRDGTELIETWEDMEDLRQANEAQRQANYQELLDTGVLQTNINTKLEALEEEYAPKLTEVTAQLDKKAEQAEVYLRSMGLSLNDFNEEDRQAILEANNIDINYVLGEKNVKAINVDDNTLVPSNTSFVKGGGGINLFNGIYTTVTLMGTDGFEFKDTMGGLGYIVEVEPNTDYSVYRSLDSDKFKLSVFDEYPTDGMLGIVWGESNALDRLTIATGETGKFLVAYVATEGTNPPSEFQITKGSDAKPYISPNEKLIIDLDKKSLPPIDVEMTNFSKRSRNLFNGEYRKNRTVTNEGYFGWGSNTGDPNTRTTNAIECVGGESYVVSGEHDRNRWRFEDDNGEFVGTANSSQVTAPENASYMYVYYSLTGEHEKFQIEKGETPTKYTPYYVIDEEFLPEIPASEENQLVLLGDDFSRYNVVEPFITEAASFDNVYNLIDDLMNEFPQYVSKSEVAITDLGTPIYRYDIQTPPTQRNTSNKVKIYLNGGTHGDERRALYGTIRFISDLLKQWKEQKSLQFLLSNIHLIYVPTLNPDGLNAVTRKNGNGVDINRNFPTDWTYNSDTESNNYTGETPASEIETNVMMNIIEENPDLYFAIDYHNYTTLENSGDVSWVGADNPLTQKIIRAWGQNYDGEIRLFSPILENHESNLVSIRDRGSGGSPNGSTVRFMESKDVNAVILEAVWGYGSTVQEGQSLNADIIGNFLLGMVRSYREFS